MKKGDVFYKIHDRRKYHIVDIIKDCDRTIVLFKFFGIHKRWWHYQIQHLWSMEDWFKNGIYSNIRFKERDDEQSNTISS
jgi:hypothetical protein